MARFLQLHNYQIIFFNQVPNAEYVDQLVSLVLEPVQLQQSGALDV